MVASAGINPGCVFVVPTHRRGSECASERKPHIRLTEVPRTGGTRGLPKKLGFSHALDVVTYEQSR